MRPSAFARPGRRPAIVPLDVRIEGALVVARGFIGLGFERIGHRQRRQRLRPLVV